jgi:hypothetical protein
MEREQRLRFIGFLFYAVLVLQLALTEEGTTFLRRVLSVQADSAVIAQSESSDSAAAVGSDPTDWTGAVPALLGLGVVFFSSEASGYLLSSITTSLWNLMGGYSGVWKRNLRKDLKSHIVDLYAVKAESAVESAGQKMFDDRLKKLNVDVLLNYFWQTCPERLILWEERRVTAFFIGCYAAFAIGLANALGTALAWKWLGFTSWNGAVLVASILFLLAILCNARSSYIEMWQIIDLWQERLFDPTLHSVLRTAGQRLVRDELSWCADRDGDHLTDQGVSQGAFGSPDDADCPRGAAMG